MYIHDLAPKCKFHNQWIQFNGSGACFPWIPGLKKTEATLRHRGTGPMFGTRNGRLDACALDALDPPTDEFGLLKCNGFLCPDGTYELLN